MTESDREIYLSSFEDILYELRDIPKGNVAGREYALAITKLEEAMMWLNRGYYKEHPTEGEK